MADKTLVLVAKDKTFKTKDTGEVKNCLEYSVNVNGVNVQLYPRKEDYTAKSLLKAYFRG